MSQHRLTIEEIGMHRCCILTEVSDGLCEYYLRGLQSHLIKGNQDLSRQNGVGRIALSPLWKRLDSLDKNQGISMEEDFLRELRDVCDHRRLSECKAEEEEEAAEDAATNQMFDLLVQIGYGDIVEQMKQGKPVKKEDLRLATQHLSARHRNAVRRRMKTLHVTFRQRRRHGTPKVDVRNIFPAAQPSSTSSSESTGRARSSGDEGAAPRLSRDSSEDSLDELDDEEDTEEERPWKTMIQVSRKDIRGDSKSSMENPSLPKYVLRLDEEGQTRIDDLSPEATEHVRRLALMELTALFDANGVFYQTRKNKKKFQRDCGIFEVPLTVLLDNDRRSDPDVRVPIFFGKLIRELASRGLNEEGLLRVPGSSSRMKAIRQAAEDGLETDLSLADPNDLAGLLKQFLRELPVPLLTWEYLDAFYEVINLERREDKLMALIYLILLLPSVHRDVLRALLDFLQDVVEHSSVNKMTIASVAMIIAPNLFLAPSKPFKRSNGGLSSPGTTSTSERQKLTLENASRVSTVVQMLVTYRDILWSVPGFIITQMRRENDDEVSRKMRGSTPLIKFLRKEKYNVTREMSEPLSDSMDGCIRVQAPHLTKSAARVKVTSDLIAADVVRLFTARKDGPLNDRSSDDLNMTRHSVPPCVDATAGCINAFDRLKFASATTRLFEVGGNLTGERCLDPEVRLEPIYRRNSKAIWRIKPGLNYRLV